jgi:hypothetical protein
MFVGYRCVRTGDFVTGIGSRYPTARIVRREGEC